MLGGGACSTRDATWSRSGVKETIAPAKIGNRLVPGDIPGEVLHTTRHLSAVNCHLTTLIIAFFCDAIRHFKLLPKLCQSSDIVHGDIMLTF